MIYIKYLRHQTKHKTKILSNSQASKKVGLQNAFTLIELLTVIAIIALLSAVVLNNLTASRMEANDTKIKEDLRQFRTAVDLYYNDNFAYPPTAMSHGNKNFAIQNEYLYKQKESWANKLSFFIKTARAAYSPTHTITQLCTNFDKVASALVEKKYLAAVPVHPYDNDAKGVCYKAVNATTTFAAYAPLTTLINVGSGSSAGIISKRTGFIVGDISPIGISNLVSMTTANETPYPIGTDATTSIDIAKSADTIYGVISGTSGSTGSRGIITSPSSTAPVTVTVPNPKARYFLSVSVTGNGWVSHDDGTTPIRISYSYGEIAKIQAHPNSGESFLYWGNCPNINGDICSITMGSAPLVNVYVMFTGGSGI